MKIANRTQINADEHRFEEGWFKRLRIFAIFLLFVGSVAAILVVSGVFDPQPVGMLQVVVEPVGQMTVDGTRRVKWLDVQVPDGDFSVRGTAVYQSGNPDSLYGLAIGTDENYLAVAVSPLGYVTVQQSTITQSSVLSPQSFVPFQTWPHIRTGTMLNEIWVDVVGDEVTVRINRELLWMGEVEGAGRQVGIVGESFGETAVFDFQEIRLFWEENHE